MHEVDQIRCGGAQTLDLPGVEVTDRRDDAVVPGAADARVQEPGEGQLVVAVLLDVRDTQLGLPKKRVISAFENLPLLGDGSDDGLQRRIFVHVPECARLDLRDDLGDAASDRPEVFESIFPEEPRLVGRVWVGLPPGQEHTHGVEAGGGQLSSHVGLRSHRWLQSDTGAPQAPILILHQVSRRVPPGVAQRTSALASARQTVLPKCGPAHSAQSC